MSAAKQTRRRNGLNRPDDQIDWLTKRLERPAPGPGPERSGLTKLLALDSFRLLSKKHQEPRTTTRATMASRRHRVHKSNPLTRETMQAKGYACESKTAQRINRPVSSKISMQISVKASSSFSSSISDKFGGGKTLRRPSSSSYRRVFTSILASGQSFLASRASSVSF